MLQHDKGYEYLRAIRPRPVYNEKSNIDFLRRDDSGLFVSGMPDAATSTGCAPEIGLGFNSLAIQC